MKTKYKLSQATLCQQAADELIGYLYLLIDELQEKYCEQDVMTLRDELMPDEVPLQIDDDILF